MRVVLTGSGVNPTLNATLGNANDNGDTIITPTLKGIETINVAFTGSSGGVGGAAVTDLDLQDATGVKHVNITRVSQATNTARIENVKQVLESMGIAKSNANEAGAVEFSFGAGTLRGENTADLNLNDVQLGQVNIGRNTTGVGAFGVGGEGYEHLSISSTGADNSVGIMNLPMDTGTNGSILISGDTNLALANSETTFWGTLSEAVRYGGGIQGNFGRLATVDASALNASFTLNIGAGMLTTGKADTSGQVHDVTITGSGNDDTFYLQDSVEAGDVIDGGAGTDTLLVNGPVNIVGKVNNVENLEIRTGHDNNLADDVVTIDADAFDSLSSIYVRNEGQILVGTVWNSVAEVMNVTLDNLTAAQANAITLAHGTTGNSDIANNILNIRLKNATGAADTATVTIVDGVNSDPVFNAQITAAAVEKVTLVDNDTEFNTVHLNQGAFTQAGSTIALEGGQADKYMNLDTWNDATTLTPYTHAAGTVGYAGYGFATNGTAGSWTSALAPAARDAAVDVVWGTDEAAKAKYVVFYGTAGTAADGATRHRVENLDAADFAGDVIIRVGDLTRADGVSSMSLKTGAGNDTFIFDEISSVDAGFTSGDTIAAGAGIDTLVIDGNTTLVPGTPRIVHLTSEWDNLTGIDVLRFGDNAGVANVGNAAQVTNAGGAYYAHIDNDFISQTDDGNRLIVVNNDGDLVNNTESDLVLDLRGLSQSKWVTFIGANGVGNAGISSNRLVLDDISANQNMILDGGDTDVRANTTPGYFAGNNNVYEVRNTAHVSINDLAQTKNFGLINFTNDQAVAQTLTLVLNNTVVENLVDSSKTATNAATQEILNIVATDGAAASVLNVDARQVDGFHALNVTGSVADNDILTLNSNVGGTAHTIALGAPALVATVGEGDRVNWVGTATGTAATPGVVINHSGAALLAGAVLDDTHVFSTGATSTAHTVTGKANVEIFDISGMTYNNSLINISALARAGTVIGGNQADVIVGSALGDTIRGNGGNDTITLNAAAVSDTVVFEATAALNGVDTVNVFQAGGAADVLDFRAFLGTTSVLAPSVNGTAADLNLAATANNVGVMFNKGIIAAADIVTIATAANGEVILTDNGKAVVLTTTAGASNTANVYNVYYVEDIDATAAQDWVVTLVGTVSTDASEMALAGNFA